MPSCGYEVVQTGLTNATQIKRFERPRRVLLGQ
jgi:hypothetical protein